MRFKFFHYCSLFFVLTFLPQYVSCQEAKGSNEEYVVVLSLDAFRWDYPVLANTPNLNSMAREGVTCQSFIPCYPSKTFPNHYSMATGLHPNNHGIVCNRFYDKDLGYYSIGDRFAVENPNFYGGEPIWATAEKQGLPAAAYYWVGSEAPIGGSRPTYWKRYDQSVSFESRMDTIIHWLSLPQKQRPRLIAWYYHEPDYTAHRAGATEASTLALVEHIDSLLGVFISRVEQLPHSKQINFIVVSDHGMADISPSRYVNLNSYVKRDWFEYLTGGSPVYSMTPKPEFKELAIKKLNEAPNIKVWERNDIPKRLNYGSNNRIQDVLIEAELGYSVGFGSDSSRYTGATHGYDNIHREMHGIFFAKGPAFKEGYKHKAVLNLNLYNIIARALKLNPAPNDGDMRDVEDMFRD